jgi:hypothetical protein
MSDAVQVALITAGFPLIAAMASLLIPILLKQHKALNEVRDQVSNSHKSNLRDDLDRALVGINKLLQGQERHTEQINTLTVDVAWLRRETYDLDKRMDLIDN